jgi:protein SCO1/2
MNNIDTERETEEGAVGPQGRSLLLIGTLLSAVMVVGGYFLFIAPKNDAGSPDAAKRSAESLPSLGTVPVEPRFIERSGTTMTLGDLRGKVWIAAFIFTRCRGTCPMMSSALSTIQRSIEGMEDVRLVSFTVDPEYDTPERMSEYAKELDASPTQWLFLTGQEDSLQTLAREVFHLGVEEGGTAEEPIIHSTRFVLVDGDGEIRGYYEGLDTAERATLLKDVKRLTSGGGESDGA